jgi:hypothetical protein
LRRYGSRTDPAPLLARSGSVEGAKTYPARISIPDDLNQAQLRLGMSGSVTVFADNAGVIGLLESILVWISSYAGFCEASMPPLGKCYPMPSRIDAGARS